ELFDFAFKTYSERWAFKHPTPADFFRTMEDASQSSGVFLTDRKRHERQFVVWYYGWIGSV
ncbi:MAG: hypothetical protein HRU26_07535, partial [Psychroserpens sp.]|nr:hypothetical protein [Psychroserpens sp.]